MKPMDEEEAIEQMELLGHDFFLFFDADANTYALLYRRRKGDYGMIIPEGARRPRRIPRRSVAGSRPSW